MRKQNLMLFPPEIAAEFVAEQEDFEAEAYRCPTGHWTIGIPVTLRTSTKADVAYYTERGL